MLRQLFCACAVLLALSLAVVAQDAPAGEKPAAKPAGPQTVTLEGTIKGLLNMGPKQLTAMVACTLVTATGEQRMQLAPQAYLTEGGLTLKNGDTITVTGVRNGRNFTVLEITQAGKSLKVRNARGAALWHPFVGQSDVTITGTIKKVNFVEPEPKPQPKPAANAATEAKPEGDAAQPAEEKPKPPVKPEMIAVSFRLETEQGAYGVTVGSKLTLETLGLTLEEGATVTVAGWQRDMPDAKKGTDPAIVAARAKWLVTPRTITIGDKTYTLRDANGKECWKPVPAPKAKAKPAEKK